MLKHTEPHETSEQARKENMRNAIPDSFLIQIQIIDENSAHEYSKK